MADSGWKNKSKPDMKIQFLGAARQVTGSCYLLEAGGLTILIDCGLYQEREYLERNWNPFPVYPGNIDYILLTHSHLDHCGLVPKLVHQGFEGTILTTPASIDLTEIIWLDSARIQEEDAAYKKKRHEREGRRGPHPEIPLYTVEDAERSLPFLKSISYESYHSLNDQVAVRFHDAGHILGAAMIEIHIYENPKKYKLIFSGDIGQWNRPLVRDPSIISRADYVVMESTYGDRNHRDSGNVGKKLASVINETYSRKGKIVIPAFAVERSQELLFYISKLVRKNVIPYMKIFLDSPMAVNATGVFMKYRQYLDEETLAMFRSGESPFDFPGLKLVRSREESKAINSLNESCIIMAGSGMCTGGRIKHHLVHNISKPESTILFTGYQARNTLGRQIIEGKQNVRILGRQWDVKAEVEEIDGLSAHADRSQLLKWLSYLEAPPRMLFLTHGEEHAAFSLAETIDKEMGWDIGIPEYGQFWTPEKNIFQSGLSEQ